MKTRWLCLLALTGCLHEPLETKSTENVNFRVERLFSVEGCNVYRFEDYRTVHMVICPDGRAKTQITTTNSCGKNCTSTKHHDVETAVKP